MTTSKSWRPRCECNAVLRKRGWYSTAAGNVQRWFCGECKRYFTEKQGSIDANAKRPELRGAILRLHASGASYRSIARLLYCSPDTVRRAVMRATAAAEEEADDMPR